MRLGYFTMPMHPMHRNWTETLQEDREGIILADKLGFYDCFVGEHLADKVETITNSMLFLSSLISDTKTIKLATGTTNLSQTHPVLVASHAAMMDHLSKGRFILGISPGSLPTDAEVLGTLDENRQKMFEESIDVILEIWKRDPPYDIDLPDNRYKVSTMRTGELSLGLGYLAKPYQQPRPEIVGTVVAPFSKGVIQMGKRDFHPMSANFLLSKWLKSHWDNYAIGKEEVGVQADRSDWRIARTIFVADDEATARRYAMEDPNGPYSFYYRQILTKFKRAGIHGGFKESREQSDDEITLDYVMKNLVIHGTPDQVTEQILELNEMVGGFGELVYAGMDWVDEGLAKRSMELLATEVMPKVRASTGTSDGMGAAPSQGAAS
jgi:alkanesulfonate monooxygenase SsuD/methylene tetrahydromethanopterin reductase-like flavin-dependent oxidoreductase (luciferase family)